MSRSVFPAERMVGIAPATFYFPSQEYIHSPFLLSTFYLYFGLKGKSITISKLEE